MSSDATHANDHDSTYEIFVIETTFLTKPEVTYLIFQSPWVFHLVLILKNKTFISNPKDKTKR